MFKCRVKGSGEYLPKERINFDSSPPTEKETGKPVVVDWEKMSKSKFNGVDPGDVLAKYGMDMSRMLILSDVSPLSDRKWDPEDSYVRITNMKKKIWKLVYSANERQQNRHQIPTIPDERIQQETAKLWDARNFYLRVRLYEYTSSVRK